MAIQTYDLTAADILARRMPDKVLSASSKPSTTQAANILTTVAGDVNGELRAVGITPTDITSSTEESYEYVRRLIEDGFLRDIVAAERSRNDETARGYGEDYDRGVQRMRAQPEATLYDVWGATTTATQPTSHITEASMTDSGTRGTDITPPFRRGDNW